MDSLREEYENADSGIAVVFEIWILILNLNNNSFRSEFKLAEKIENVAIQCKTEDHVYLHDKSETRKWIFLLRTTDVSDVF